MAITASQLNILFKAEGVQATKSQIDGVSRSLGDAATKSQGFWSGALSAGLGFIGANIFGRAASGVAEFATAGFSFEQQMSAIQAVTGATGAEFESLSDLALQIGKDTSFGATEAAFAIEALAKAGISTTDILNGAADATTALAAAGGVDLTTAATVMSNAMNQFGIAGTDAARVADVLAAASAISSTGVAELGESLKYVGLSANALGYDLETTTTALAIMADAGLVGSTAGTALNNMLTSLANPTAKASALMGELGLSFTDLNGNMKPLEQIITDVAVATTGMGAAQRAAYLETLFGIEGGRAMNALLNTQSAEAKAAGKSWQDYYAGVTQSGAAAEQAAARMDNFMGDVDELTGSIETAAIMITMTFLPSLRGMVQAGTGAINWIVQLIGLFAELQGGNPFERLMKSLRLMISQNFTGKWVVPVIKGLHQFEDIAMKIGDVASDVAGIVGDVFGEALSFLGDHLGTVIKVLGAFAAALATLAGYSFLVAIISGIGVAIGALLSPIALVLAALTGLYLAWSNNFLGLRDLTDAVFSAIGGFFDGLMDKVMLGVLMFQTLTDLGLTPVQAAVETLVALFPSLEGAIRAVGSIIEPLVAAFQAFSAGNFSEGFDHVRESLTNLALALANAAIAAGSWILDVGVPAVTGWIVDAAGNVWEALKAAAGWAWDNVANIGEVIIDIAGWLAGPWPNLWNWVKEQAQTVWSQLGALAVNIGEIIVDIAGYLKGAWPALWDFISSTAQSIWGIVKSSAVALADVLIDVAGYLKGAWPALWGFISSTTQTIWSAIKSAAVAIADVLIDVTSYTKNTVADITSTIDDAVQSAYASYLASGTAPPQIGPIKFDVSGYEANPNEQALEDEIESKMGNDAPMWQRVYGKSFMWGFTGVQKIVDGINKGISAVGDALTGGSGGWSQSWAVTGAKLAGGGIIAFVGAFDGAMSAASNATRSIPMTFYNEILAPIGVGLAKVVGLMGEGFMNMFGPDSPPARGLSKAKDALVALFDFDWPEITWPTLDIPLPDINFPTKDDLIGLVPDFMREFWNDPMGALKSWVTGGGGTPSGGLDGSNEYGNGTVTGDFGSGGSGFFNTGLKGGNQKALNLGGLFGGRRPRHDPASNFAPIVSALAALQASFTTAQAAITTSTTAITTAITTGATQWVTQVTQATQRIIQVNQQSWMQVQQVTTQTLTQLAALVTQNMTRIAQVVQQQLTQVRSVSQSTWQQIQSQVTSTLSRLASDVQSKFSQMAQQAQSNLQRMQSTTQSTMQAMQSAVSQAATRIASEMQRGAQQAAQAVQTAMSRLPGIVQSAGGGAASAAYGVGQNISAGLRDGILSLAGAIASAAASVVTNAINAAKSAAAIASPSRIMRNEVGQMLIRGATLGVLDEARSFADTMAKVVTDGIGATSGGLDIAMGRTSPAGTFPIPEHVPWTPSTVSPGITYGDSHVQIGDINVIQQPGEHDDAFVERLKREVGVTVIRAIQRGEASRRVQ